MTTPRIAVGVDGSRFAAFALDWTIARAAALGDSVEVVHAWLPPTNTMVEGISLPAPPLSSAASSRHMVQKAVDSARRRTRKAAPPISVSVKKGEAARVLSAVRAHHLVVGTQGLGFVDRAILGSTADRVIALAHHPVTVVPFRRSLPVGDGRIVVGVDGSASGDAAVEYAMRVAAKTKAPLVVVCVFAATGAFGSDASHAARRSMARATIDRAIDTATEKGAPMPKRVSRHTVSGSPAAVLADIAKPASELVVGFGRHRRPLGFLGSVSRRCVHRAPCPVTVVKSAAND